MKCRDAREIINSYIDNGLDPEKDKMLMEHVAKCHRCSEELRFLIEYKKTVKEIRPVKAPANFMEELNKRLESEERGRFSRLFHDAVTAWRRFTFPLEAAGVIAVALLIFFLYTPLFHGVKKTATWQEDESVTERATDRATERKGDVPPSIEKRREGLYLSVPAGKKLSESGKAESSGEDKGVNAADDILHEKNSRSAEKSLYEYERGAAKESISEIIKKDEEPTERKRRAVSSDSKAVVTADITPESIISSYGGVIISRTNPGDRSVRYTVKIEKYRLSDLSAELKNRYSATYRVTGSSGSALTVEFSIRE